MSARRDHPPSLREARAHETATVVAAWIVIVLAVLGFFVLVYFAILGASEVVG